MTARRIKRTSPTPRRSTRQANGPHGPAGGEHNHDHGDHDDNPDHDHPHGHDHPHSDEAATVPVSFHVNVTSTSDDEPSGPLGLYLFDEEERPLCHCQVANEHGQADVPRRLIGQMATVAVAPVGAGRKEPTLDTLRAREVPILRVLLAPVKGAIDLGVPPRV